MDLDYQSKYFKSKQKYLDLKYKEYSGGVLDFIFKTKKRSCIRCSKKNGSALENFKDFQDDKYVVLAAVRNHGYVLQFASP